MEGYCNFQIDTCNLIIKGFANFKKSPKERVTVSYIQTRLENLEIQWQSFYDTHRKLVYEVSNENLTLSDYYKLKTYETAEENYIEFKCLLKEKLSKLSEHSYQSKPSGTNDSNSGQGNNFSAVRLPQISIPIFSGKYTEWTTFRDLFLSLIDKNHCLDDVQKLHYLKGHLSGEAEQFLRHIPITSNNYNVCWTQLKSRYDNKRYLSNHILKSFMGQRILQFESSSAIKEILDSLNECLHGLQNLGIDVSNWDIIVIYIVSQKLDPESRKQWEAKASSLSEELPTLSIFKKFLEHRFRSLEFLDVKPKSKPMRQNACHVVNSQNIREESDLVCIFCKGNHKLTNCKLFAKDNFESRRNFVQTNKLCFNCLGESHPVFFCRDNSRCKFCRRKHHSLLHSQYLAKSTEKAESVDKEVSANVATTSLHDDQDESQSEPESVVACFSTAEDQGLLPTALVRAESNNGNNVTLRCLLDQGSQTSFITESSVQALGLQKVPANIEVSGVGDCGSSRLKSKSMVVVRLRSIHDPSFIGEVKAYVLNKVTTHLPSRRVVVPVWSELGSLQLADPKFNVPNKIDLLLGAKWYSKILKEGLIRDPSGLVVAQDTKLGWILSGEVCSERQEGSRVKCNTIVSLHAQVNENELLRKFWEIESEPTVNTTGKKMFTEEEKRCEDIFKATTIRDESGRYIVKLPFRDDDPCCKHGNSKYIAAKRLHLLERRLERNCELKQKYTEVLNEYVHLDHMELIPENERDNSEAVYLPHHAVVREDKTTTKLRVVFDASCQGTNGVSLNQDLMVGPTLQSDLRHLVMRWRLHPICLVADIVKMYRQVKVNQVDADFQRILWHDSEGQLQHYRMLRVTFGTASAPYLAVRTLQQLARDEGKDLKRASERVLRDFYSDDLMTGCDSVEEGFKVYTEMNELLERGGFQLQKWNSNNKEFLERVGEAKQMKDKLEIGTRDEREGVMKVLGLSWNKSCDEFIYSVRLPPLSSPVTKRKVVSDISRLFDPLGWIAPVIITAKIFIQKIWLSGIDWDQELPVHLLQEWLRFRNELVELNGFSIPRWIHINRDDKLLELHGFSDASNKAYAGVVYIRVISNNEDIHVSLVASKTKVSPIKQVSIPRLELCGAMLLSKLLYEVADTLSIPRNQVYAWTDSSVVLAWLSSHPSRWKPFVANRVTEIITLFDRNQWSHVSSVDNPADCASRGVQPSELRDVNLWREGPSWLHTKRNFTPLYYGVDQDSLDTDLEEKAKFSGVVNVSREDAFFSRFSSLRRLIRIVAWCKRFCATGLQTKPNWLTTKELQESLSSAIKRCQECHFFKEPSDKKGKFASLNPYKDNNGIWRVGGRLQNATINETQKHPMLIPRGSHLAKLIIADAHERTLHGGPTLMISYIRSKFWIVDIKSMAKSYVHKCVVCVRHASKTNNPIMGQLPTSRVTASRPFSNSGVDYAGPIAVRTTKGRGHRSTKGYICLFICMATRAIHLEAVSDLTSEAFLAAFKRFVARRGQCTALWSDNATTFVGADRELRAVLASEKSSVAIEIAHWLGDNGTTWHRIPPYSPNFGRLWEAGIKSTKFHLKRVIGNSTLTFEELTTVLAQIEACLNSRPISRISDDADEPYPLTPGHFLVGEPLVLVPDVNYESSNISHLRRWQFTQRMVQDFWRRWSHEYLTQFLHRYKWRTHSPEPKVGDVVLVKEDDLPPAKWLYGIITAKHPGLDEVTRVVTLRCKGALVKRPVSKLCVLPITE